MTAPANLIAPMIVAGTVGLETRYVTEVEDLAGKTIYTFSAVDLGDPSARRMIVLGVGGYDNTDSATTISSVTVNGVAVTTAVTRTETVTGFRTMAGLYYIELDAGSSATIVVTFSSAVDSCYVAVWALHGYGSATPAFTTAHSLKNDTSSALNLSCNVAIGDTVIAYFFDLGNSGSVVWTGLTENFDRATGEDTRSGASLIATAAESPRTITINRTSTGHLPLGMLAIWR